MTIFAKPSVEELELIKIIQQKKKKNWYGGGWKDDGRVSKLQKKI